MCAMENAARASCVLVCKCLCVYGPMLCAQKSVIKIFPFKHQICERLPFVNCPLLLLLYNKDIYLYFYWNNFVSERGKKCVENTYKMLYIWFWQVKILKIASNLNEKLDNT